MITLKLYQDRINTSQGLTIQCQKEQFQSYQNLKRIIIKHLDDITSNLNDIQVSFKGIYKELPQMITPILSQQNLQYFIDLFGQKTQFCLFISRKQSILRKAKSKFCAIEFNSDGDIDDQQQPNIKPNQKQYDGNNVVECIFCNKNNQDRKSIRILGPFYGPYCQNKYFHLICAIWCKNIYIGEEGQLMGVESCLKQQFLKGKCSNCKKKGGGLQCNKCRYRTHYQCGLGTIKYNWLEYTFFCPKCQPQEKSQDQQINQVQFKMDVE